MKIQKFTTVLAIVAASSVQAQYSEDISNDYNVQVQVKAEKCVNALELNIDPLLVSEQFTSRKTSKRLIGRANSNDDELTLATRCVRNMNNFEVKYCERKDGSIDPELCLEYQIQKILQAEAHTQNDLDPEFGTGKYQEQTAVWKKNKIWEKIIEDDTAMPFITGEDISDLFFEDMDISFDHFHDVLPPGREKLLHPEGVVMKVAYIPQPNIKYTGMFNEVQQHGIMRISDALASLPGNISSPGFGLKFLRDGMYAADAVTLVSVDGQNSYNFFKNRYPTQIPPGQFECAAQTIGKKFAEATDHIGTMSIMDWGQYRQDGTEEEDPVWPFRLEFEGINNYGWTDEYEEDYKEMFKKIQPGSVLFNVYAFESPVHKLVDHDGQFIGKIVLTSEAVTSQWGDKNLFFRHQRIDDDLVQKPEWEDYLIPFALGSLEETGLERPPSFPLSTCPFAYLWDMMP